MGAARGRGRRDRGQRARRRSRLRPDPAGRGPGRGPPRCGVLDRRPGARPGRHDGSRVGAGRGHRGGAARAGRGVDVTRVMVVDDHPMWREAVARDLAEAGHEVVATAGDGGEAVRRAPAARPEVAVVDLQLPVLSGVEVTRALVAGGGRVLVLSASGEQTDVLEAVKAGATGYLVKSASSQELLSAVEATARGEAVFTPGLAGLVLGE